jgi:CheY-like chemotaxis protein
MVLRDELPPSDVRRADLEEIVQSAFRARDLTRQLLAFARQQKLVLQNLQLNQVVSRMERMLRRTLRENVLIELRLVEPLPLIQGDLGQLEQVVLNLAINAQDAMPDGGRLVIGTREARHPSQHGGVPAGHFVCLIVTDTGHGMDEKTKGRIFDPFFTTKELGRGTGLGLSTVYGIVRQHQAFIEVESEQGKGTTFTLYFPAHAVEGAPDKPETGTETPPARCQGLVLLVEDQPRVRVSTRRVLERQGYRVIDVGTGAEALELAARQTEPIDLLVTDVIMDGLNGVQVQQALMGIFPKLRTLYMSGYPADVIGRHGVLEKGIHFLPKPFTPEELIRACQRACA